MRIPSPHLSNLKVPIMQLLEPRVNSHREKKQLKNFANWVDFVRCTQEKSQFNIVEDSSFDIEIARLCEIAISQGDGKS